jgi:ribosomal protein S10
MRILNIVLRTKNKNSLQKFLTFFNENTKKNFNYIKKNFSKNNNKIVFTVLKSPHVNKSAQEQFEIRPSTVQLTIMTSQIFKTLIFLKKLKNNAFADINFKIKFLNSLKKQNLMEKKVLNPDNFKIHLNFKTKKSFYTKKSSIQVVNSTLITKNRTKYLMKLITIYGLVQDNLFINTKMIELNKFNIVAHKI